MPEWQHCATCGAALGGDSPTAQGSFADEGNGAARPPASWFKRHRRGLRITAVVISVVVLLGVADWFRTNQELSSVFSADKTARSSVRRYNVEVKGLQKYEKYQEPAARALARVADGRQRIEDVTVLPWHRSVVRCRDRLADYYEAIEAYLRAIASQSRGPFEPLGADIDAAYRQQHRVCRAAVPPFALFNLERRADEQL
jgi:hypothetical protein